MKWNFEDIRITEYLNDSVGKFFNHIGFVRSGNLCFDLMYEGENDILEARLYVGGIDSGYGYTENGYPYDYEDSVGKEWNADTFKGMNIETFKKFMDDELTKVITESKPIEFKDTKYSLLDKANMELHIW